MKRKSALIVAILIMCIAFAAISTTLIINGNARISENSDDFSVIFTAATLDGTDVYTQVIDDTKKIITFSTSELKTLNQTSVLNYEVTNNSSNYDVEVTVNCKVKDDATAKYTSIKNELENNATVVKAKESVNGTLTVTLNKTATEEVKEQYVCELKFNAEERDTLGVGSISFTEDSWETIAKNVKAGKTDTYKVGDTKTIIIASHFNDCSSTNGLAGADYKCNSSNETEKELIIRIANKSECTTETSETACGFVIEFENVIENHIFNKANATYQYGKNIGGWRDSELRTYINETIYNALPNDLQDVISVTKVISGHGETSGEENFETQDKLYLLSTKEIFGNPYQYDTINAETRQLDYYKNKGISENSYGNNKKFYKGTADEWWLRSARSITNYGFLRISNNGLWGFAGARNISGISPAFRIA